MKKILVFTFCLLIVFSFNNCKKEKTEEPATNTPTTTTTGTQATVAKKWEVASQSSRIAATSYVFFEFTSSGKYIVAYKDASQVLQFLYGNYTISPDGKTITLTGAGVITITSVSATNFSFIFTPTGMPPVTIGTTVGAAVASSSKTTLLAKGWKMSKLMIDTTQCYPSAAYTKYEVTFTQYGTYFIYIELANGNKQIDNRYWQWSDASETKICYGLTSSVCTGNNLVTVNQLTSTYLKITETQAIAGTMVAELAPL